MMQHDEILNLSEAKSNDNFKLKSESIGNIWSKWKKCKVNKKKVIDDAKTSLEINENNDMTNISMRSSEIPKIMHQIEKPVSYANSGSKSINEEMKKFYNADVIADNKSDVKFCDNIIFKDEFRLSDGTGSLCQSETRLMNQGLYITPKKLSKRSRIPQRCKKFSVNPNISQHYPRFANNHFLYNTSLQRLKRPIIESLSEMEIIPVEEMDIKETRNEKIEDELSVNINEISNDTELLSSPHQLSKKSSSDSRVLTSAPEFESQLPKLNHFETSKNDLSETSTWNEIETSETESTSPTQRKVLYRQPFRIAHSTTMSSSNSTTKSLSKSVCSEHERYKFIDALLEIICWPFLFFQQEEE